MGSDKWTGMPNIMLWGRNRESGGGNSFFYAWKTVVQHPCGAGITTVHTGYISTGSMDFISRLSVHVLVSSCSNLGFCRNYMATVTHWHTYCLRINGQPLMKNIKGYLCRANRYYSKLTHVQANLQFQLARGHPGVQTCSRVGKLRLGNDWQQPWKGTY